MLKSWSIKNFKPIVNSGELKLAPVTVLAGRNSSGKSSLLQSILMISQTLSSRVLDRPLLPNERIIQLGTFEDILNENFRSRTLTVDFELEMEKDESKPSLQSSPETRLDVKSAKVSFNFSSSRGDSTSFSAVEASNITMDSALLEFECSFRPIIEGKEADIIFFEEEAAKPKFSFLIQKANDRELSQFLQKVTSSSLGLVPYNSKQSNYLGDFITDDSENRGPYLVTLSHFLPTRLVRKYKLSERFKQIFMTLLNYLFEFESLNIDTLAKEIQRFSDVVDFDISISEGLRKYLNDLYENAKIPEKFSGQSRKELITWFNSLEAERFNGGKRVISNDLQEKLVQDLMQTISNLEFEQIRDSEGLEVIANDPYVRNLEQAVDQISRFFTSRIRYLGPLRADPWAAQQRFAPTSELDDVGAKGEYAAVVYHYNQLASIKWYSPKTNQIEQGTLKEALDIWAQYLGVANQITTEEAGQLGISWKVILKEGQRPRSLPEVGVGVSQILPILVMGLLSPVNTLLIMEQPELHLHPSVQARLGDFFVGLSNSNKQSLIETHSENLVSQLRYHIVQAGGQDKSDCIIYFVDQDEKGAAKFEPVEISPRGNILNWPEGYFDETMLQEDRITAASLKKRAQLAKND